MHEEKHIVSARAFVSQDALRPADIHSGENSTEEQVTMVVPEAPEISHDSPEQFLTLALTDSQPVVVGDFSAESILATPRSALAVTNNVSSWTPNGTKPFSVLKSAEGGYYVPNSSPGIQIALRELFIRKEPARQNFTSDLTDLSASVSGDLLIDILACDRNIPLPISTSEEGISETAKRCLLALEIKSYANLPPDWDCDGGHAPLKKDIANAVHFLRSLRSGDIPRPMVAGDGDVGFIWKTKSSYLEVGFCDDGQISFYGKTSGGHEDGGDHDYANKGIPKKLWKLLESIAHVTPHTD